ncbi:MAG: thiamine-phosphate kinase, partial [Methylobacteriaceae bacterium]|nr:thiamine-phosphate kinase [Methylobacteriaceae bacterium]
QAQAAGVQVTAIGTAKGGAGEPPIFLDSRGEPRQFARGSFSHF